MKHHRGTAAARAQDESFEWRAAIGAWRWLILGSLGIAPYACGGRTDVDPDGLGGSAGSGASPGTGGTGGSPAIHLGTGGGGGIGGFSGSAGTSGSVGMPNGGNAGSAGSASMQPSGCYADGTALEGGFQGCTNGMRHRVTVGTCPSFLPADGAIPEEYRAQADAGVYDCTQDSDCTDRPHGHCALGQGGPYCTYGCVTDAECDVNQLCLCDTPVGRCVETNCRTDSDCGFGMLCGSHAECYSTRFACQTPRDECAVNSDCPAGNLCVLRAHGYGSEVGAPPPGAAELPAPAGERRECELVACPVIGRPFLVAGSERLASCVVRRDWYPDGAADARAAGSRELPPELRHAIASGWTEQALMEHASVAAFARFALQLLSLGAPPELVTGAASAMQDEIRHARDCFRLARRHADGDLGPGVLSVEGALAELDLTSVVLTTVREGCVGETLAALEAAEVLQHCEDAEARAVLERIAEEETRHAELAWRFVAWALETGPRELAGRVREAFAEASRSPAARSPIGLRDRELARHGLLSAPLRQALRQRVLAEVVAPCADALLTRRSTPAASLRA